MGGFRALGIPIILMVGHKTQRTLDHARAGGATPVVETQFHDGVLFDEIRQAVNGSYASSGKPA